MFEPSLLSQERLLGYSNIVLYSVRSDVERCGEVAERPLHAGHDMIVQEISDNHGPDRAQYRGVALLVVTKADGIVTKFARPVFKKSSVCCRITSSQRSVLCSPKPYSRGSFTPFYPYYPYCPPSI